MPTRYPGGAAGSHGQGTTVPTCIRDIRAGLQDLTGGEHQIEHAYNVSGRGCRISRVGNYRSYMPTRHQEGTSGSHGFETPDRTCLLGVRTALHDLTGPEHKIENAYNVSGRSCRISGIGNYRPYMPNRHQEETFGSHWFETPDRTCLLGVRTALHDLIGSEHKIVHAYKVSGRGCKSQNFTGSDRQIQHAYKVSDRGCRTSRVRHIRSNLPKRYQVGVAGSQG